jgi:hypothetical protein
MVTNLYNSIVKIRRPVDSSVGRFCFDNGLTGFVVGDCMGRVEINFGFPCNVFVDPDDLEMIVEKNDLPFPLNRLNSQLS